ncbi:MAG TPA: GDSL-type esterase/lipase family protein [Humisphaera sp.]
MGQSPATRPATAPAVRPLAKLPDGVRPEQRFGQAPADAPAPLPPAFENGKFDLRPNEVVVFAGQTNMVRAQQAGWLEAQLAVSFAGHKPRFRSMAWEGDTAYEQWRDLNFGGWREQLRWAGATAVIAQFGQTESLDGVGKLDAFAAAYGQLLDELCATTKRVVVVSPMPFERPADPLMPDLSKRNDDVRAYAEACRKLAADRGLVYVDLFTPLVGRSAADGRLTSNGIHLTPDGQRAVANAVVQQLGLTPRPDDAVEPVRRAVVDKNQLWFDNWRPMNWAFAYGDRQHVPFSKAIGDHPPLRIELEEFKPLVMQADERIHDLAAKPK